MKYMNMKSAPENCFQSIWGTPWLSVTAFENPDIVPQPSDIVVETLKTLDESAIYLPSTTVSETLNRITSDLTVIREETIANIVMGKLSVEDGLNAYKEQAKALGIDQVLAEMNQE